MSSHKQPSPSVSSSVSVSESLAATVQTLVRLNEAEFLTSLTPADRRQLAAALAALRSVVGEEENHLFAPLMDFIGNLIERDLVGTKKSEAKIGIKCQNDSSATGTPDSHRPERMGRPAMLPRLKMAELLAQETGFRKAEEIDTGTPVGKEVW